MDRKVATFLSTLRDPRFTSKTHDPTQPFVLTGVLNGQEVDFYASPTDPMDYGREIHRRVVAGELGEIGGYVAPPQPDLPPKRRA
jgi:hypothetical protein